METIIINNEEEMASLARSLARKALSDKKRDSAFVIGLVGDLGVGKTTLVRYFLAELGVSGNILSPTFVLMKSYNLKAGVFNLAVHVDCYRLASPVKALKALNFEQILKNKNVIVLVEWAERVKELLPKDMLWIELDHGGGEKRKIKVC